MVQTLLRNRITRLWFAVLTAILAIFTPASFQNGLCEGDRCGESLGHATKSKVTKETITLLDEWGNAPDANAASSAFRFVGYQLKPFCKYEKEGASLVELSRSVKEEQISFDEFLGVDVSKLDQKSRWAYQRGMPTVVGANAAVIYVLRKSRAVTSKDWHHKYHHVAHKDQHGYITGPDGTRIIWMLRPGGLGVLVYPDGGTMFLVFEEVDGLK